MQHCSTEEQWATSAASAAGKLRSISLVCRLHNTITLHLTAVKSVKSKSTSKSGKVLVNLHIFCLLLHYRELESPVSQDLIMTHLVGIDKGPVMDWTNDIGLGERYRKWKKCVEVLFKGHSML